MTTTQTTEAIRSALQILTAEAEIAFIQRTDSPAAKLVWEAKVDMVNRMTVELRAA